MPKKTSRAARVAQNSQKRISSARPMTATASTLDDAQDDFEEAEDAPIVLDMLEEKVEIISERPSMLRPVAAPTIEVDRPAATSSAGRTIPRRFATPQAPKQPVVNRVQEYSFIRSDLITVTILTILMVVILVVLAVFLSK